MKYLKYLVILLCLVSCSSQEPDNTYVCCSQTIIESVDLIQTRSTNFIYLKTKNEVLEIPIQHGVSERYIDICFKTEKGDILAISNNKSIKVGKKRNCFFTTIPNGVIKLPISNYITPNGNKTYSACDDIAFKSDIFTFTSLDKKIYLNSRSGVQDIEKHPIIELERMLFLAKVNVIISDLHHGIFFHDLSTKEFESELGSVNDWQVQFFIDDFPTQYNIFNTQFSKKDIVALSDKETFIGNLSHDAIQLQWGEPVIIGRFKGVGVLSNYNPFLFPININGKDLCLSFYNNKFNSTLRVPIESLNIKPNIEQEIFIVLDFEDFSKMTRSSFMPYYKVYYYEKKIYKT